MRNFITQAIRIVVGILFVYSGYVKLIDPKGSGYKFTEYFEIFSLDFLIPYALPFAIFLIIVETMLGIMLLVGYKSKLTIWSLAAIMIVFLFLTFYSAYTGKVTDCGCFGDAIKISAWETFYKNVIFMVLIIWLLLNTKYVRPFYSSKLSGAISILFLLASGFITYYVLNHLPLIDFRPFAVGKHIPSQMMYPEDAKKDVFDITFIYNVDGVDKEFKESEKPWEIKGAVFVDRKTTLIEKGYEPPIHDFTLEKNGVDLTEQLMQLEKLMLIVSYNISKANSENFHNIKIVTDKALNNGYTVYLITASPKEDFEAIKTEFNLDFDMLFCDETTLKTIIRSNPGIVTINKGTIEGKWSYNDYDKVKIKEGMGRKAVTLDFALKASLDSIFILDQKYRSIINAKSPIIRDSLLLKFNISKDSLGTDFWEKQSLIDKSNIAFLDKVIKEYGYPGRSLVGELSKDSAANIIINSNSIGEYLDVVKEAAEKNELTYTKAATMEDMYLMSQNKAQIYGTQITFHNEEYIIWPIKDVESVNSYRKDAGFDLTIYEFGKEAIGEDYVFEAIPLEEVVGKSQSTALD